MTFAEPSSHIIDPIRMPKKIYLLLLSVAFLSACSTSGNRAPVVERTGSAAPSAALSAPLSKAAEDAARDPNLYQVKKGDTVLRIAFDHGQSYRDLVQWNNLSNPNDIKVDQFLRVVAPDSDSPGVQTSSVTMAPTESRTLAALPAQVASVPSLDVPKKSLPRGEKRVYSDTTLAEMERKDGSVVPASLPFKPVSPLPKAGADDDKLSFIWPSDGKLVTTFEEGKNKGIDIAGKIGQQVLAAAGGKVMYAGSDIRGYGNLLIVKHSNNLLSAYAHNRVLLVKQDQIVSKGQPIAEMGNSDADSVKLHFEIRQQGKPVDPLKFLPNR